MLPKTNYAILIQLARKIAAEKHLGQKYGDKPYFYHIQAVVDLTNKIHKFDPKHMIVAYLHDALEDTDLCHNYVEDLFGKEILDNILILTDEDGDNRKLRKQRTHLKIKESKDLFKIGLSVKIIDRIANIQEGIKTQNIKKLKMYLDENDEFLNAIHRDYLSKEIEMLNKTVCVAQSIIKK